MNFNHVKLSELDFELEAVTTENGRWYTTPKGNVYPSITTVLSSYNKGAIQQWRQSVGEDVANKISKKAADRGTKLHAVCEDYLNNKLSPLRMQTMMPDTKSLFLQLRPFIDENIGDVYAIEQPLYSDRLKVAGRVDLIAYWNGALSIIDYKSSTKEKNEDWIQNYFLQCSAYAEMFGEITGREISQIVVAIAVEDGMPQIFTKQKIKYLPTLNEFVGNYHTNLLTD
jgi:genome maintenance exonuclease 1